MGALTITTARIGAGYLHDKENNITVTSLDPPWLTAIHDINTAILALVQTLIQICLLYLGMRGLSYLARKLWSFSTGSGSVGSPIAPTNVGTPPA